MELLHTDTRELWLIQSRDCSQEPLGLDFDRARFIVAVHGGHGAGCRQYLSASAFCYRRTAER